jgi:hypothetical protein
MSSAFMFTDIVDSTDLWRKRPSFVVRNIVRQNFILSNILHKMADGCLQVNEIGDAWHVECDGKDAVPKILAFAVVSSQMISTHLPKSIKVRFGVHIGPAKHIRLLPTKQWLLSTKKTEKHTELLESTADFHGFGLNLSKNVINKLDAAALKRFSQLYTSLIGSLSLKIGEGVKKQHAGRRSKTMGYFWFFDFTGNEANAKARSIASKITRWMDSHSDQKDFEIISSQNQGYVYNAVAYNSSGHELAYEFVRHFVGLNFLRRASYSLDVYWKIQHDDVRRVLSHGQNKAARALYKTDPNHMGAIDPQLNRKKGWHKKNAAMKGLTETFIYTRSLDSI